MTTLVSDTAGRGSLSPLQRWRSRWVLSVALTLVGGLVGLAVGLAVPPVYTAESRAAVGAGAFSSGAAAEFPQASSQLAASYARYVNDAGLADGVEVTASPIPDSNVVRIEGFAPSRSEAVDISRQALDGLLSSVNDSSGEALLEEYDQAAQSWAEALRRQDVAQTQLDALVLEGRGTGPVAGQVRTELSTAVQDVASTQLVRDSLGEEYRAQRQTSQSVGLREILEPQVTQSSASATRQRFVALGLLAGAFVSFVLSLLLGGRAPGTRRRSADAAAAKTPSAEG